MAKLRRGLLSTVYQVVVVVGDKHGKPHKLILNFLLSENLEQEVSDLCTEDEIVFSGCISICTTMTPLYAADGNNFCLQFPKIQLKSHLAWERFHNFLSCEKIIKHLLFYATILFYISIYNCIMQCFYIIMCSFSPLEY